MPLKEAPHNPACIPNQPILVTLINKAEIHRAPETPNPSALTIVEGSPERELSIPMNNAQPRRMRPPTITQKRRPPRDRPSINIPPTIRAERHTHLPAMIKARLPQFCWSCSLTLKVYILFMISLLF
jgi:hypothetical protein